MNFATEPDIRTAASEAFATSQASTCESWSSERRFARIFDSSNLLSITNNRTPIYKASMEEARWRAVCPGTFTPVLMTLGKCSYLRAKLVYFSGHLPPVQVLWSPGDADPWTPEARVLQCNLSSATSPQAPATTSKRGCWASNASIPARAACRAPGGEHRLAYDHADTLQFP